MKRKRTQQNKRKHHQQPRQRTGQSTQSNGKPYKSTQSWIKERIAELPPDRVRPFKRTCVFHMKGKCLREDCTFAHMIKPKSSERCKFFMVESCTAGDRCCFSHNIPCKYYQVFGICRDQTCAFNHSVMSYDQRTKLLQEFECVLPPAEIHHDFKRLGSRDSPHPLLRPETERDGQDPFTKQGRAAMAKAVEAKRSATAEASTVSALANDSDIAAPRAPSGLEESEKIEDEIQQTKPLLSLRGFYKDTLENEESDSEYNESSPEMPVLEIEASMENNTADESDMEEEPVIKDTSPWNVIDANFRSDIPWKLVKAETSFPSYGDLRKAFMISMSVIDPRLCIVNRKLPPKNFSTEGDVAANREKLFRQQIKFFGPTEGETGIFKKRNPRKKRKADNSTLNSGSNSNSSDISKSFSPLSPTPVTAQSGELQTEEYLPVETE